MQDEISLQTFIGSRESERDFLMMPKNCVSNYFAAMMVNEGDADD
jgi:hypothetical protein